MPTTATVPGIPGENIATGAAELAELIRENEWLAESMNIFDGPKVTIHVDDAAVVQRFADLHRSKVGRSEIGDYWHVFASAKLASLTVTLWTRSYDAVSEAAA